MSQPPDRSGDGEATLVAVLDHAAAALDPTPARDVAGFRVTWRVGERPIAVLDEATASFRVGVEIGAAARRTDDAGDSALGADWVAFRPPVLDEPAIDRITAWFAAAYRRAASPDR